MSYVIVNPFFSSTPARDQYLAVKGHHRRDQSYQTTYSSLVCAILGVTSTVLYLEVIFKKIRPDKKKTPPEHSESPPLFFPLGDKGGSLHLRDR